MKTNNLPTDGWCVKNDGGKESNRMLKFLREKHDVTIIGYKNYFYGELNNDVNVSRRQFGQPLTLSEFKELSKPVDKSEQRQHFMKTDEENGMYRVSPSNSSTTTLTTCDGTIGKNGICDKCYQVSQNSSNKCIRLIECEPVNQTGQVKADLEDVEINDWVEWLDKWCEFTDHQKDYVFLALRNVAKGKWKLSSPEQQCLGCDKPIIGKTFYDDDDNSFCEPCYKELAPIMKDEFEKLVKDDLEDVEETIEAQTYETIDKQLNRILYYSKHGTLGIAEAKKRIIELLSPSPEPKK